MDDTPSVTAHQLLHAKGNALVAHLKTLADELAHIEQTDDHGSIAPELDEALQSCAAALATIVKRKSAALHGQAASDVKLLAACCLSDLLRIYAPETPFSAEDLKIVFELFVSQLRGVGDTSGPSFHRYFYLLERLAMVKSFVLMIDLKCDDLVRQLFEVLFESISDEHSIRVSTHMLDILGTCLEEVDVIAQPLVDAILENLVEPAKTEKPAAYGLAQKLLRQRARELQAPLHQFLSGCLPSSASVVDSDLRDEWSAIVVELTRASIELVSYVLPQLTEVVAMEDESMRLKGASLLGQLFSEVPQVVREFPQLVTALAAKLTDVCVAVRSAVVGEAVQLVVRLPHLSEQLLPPLADRLMDPDERVRSSTVRELCDAAMDDPAPFAAVLRQAGHRLFDKRPAVRSAARQSLTALYRRHIDAVTSADAGAHASDADEGLSLPESLAFIPQQLLQSYGAEAVDVDSRVELERLLQAKLLPASRQARLLVLPHLHESLDPAQRKALLLLLRRKRQLQRQLQQWLALQRRLKEKSKDEAAAAESAKLVSDMCSQTSDAEGAKLLWEAMASSKDKKVSRALATLLSTTSTDEEAEAARDELRGSLSQRVDKPTLQLVEELSTRASMSLLCAAGAKQLLQSALERLTASTDKSTDAALELLVEWTAVFPQLLEGAGADVAAALQAAASGSGGLEQVLRLVHNVSPSLAAEPSTVRKQLVATLCQKCCGKDVASGKMAAQCLSTSLLLPSLRPRTFATLTQRLRAAVEGKPGRHQQCALAALAALAKREPAALRHDEQLLPLVEKMVQGSAAGASTDAQLSAQCEAQRLALKLLANEVAGSAGAGAAPADDAGVDQPCDALGAALEPPERRAARLVAACLRVIEADGAVGAAAAGGSAEAAKLRLAAGCALLKMARVSSLQMDATLGSAGWHRLAWLMQDDEATVRSAFAAKLTAEMMRPFLVSKKEGKSGAPLHFQSTRKLGLPPNYCTMLALAAVDAEKPIVAAARHKLSTIVQRWRLTAEQLKSPRLMPEVQLPWLIHLLAHSPTFDEENEDAPPTLPTTQRCLDLFLGVVLSGGGCEFDLLRTTANLVKRATDRTDPDAERAHVVADVAREIIGLRGRTGKFSQTPVPPIPLPALLFFRTSERPLCQDVDMLPVGFKLLEGIGRAAGASAAPAANKRSSPPSRRAADTHRITHRSIPSPIRGSSAKKRKPRAKRRRSAQAEEEEEEEDDEEEEAADTDGAGTEESGEDEDSDANEPKLRRPTPSRKSLQDKRETPTMDSAQGARRGGSSSIGHGSGSVSKSARKEAAGQATAHTRAERYTKRKAAEEEAKEDADPHVEPAQPKKTQKKSSTRAGNAAAMVPRTSRARP